MSRLWVLLFLFPWDCILGSDSDGACKADGSCANTESYEDWKPRTISVVLPCANEAEFALKTVKSVSENTPADVLYEIVVVDDGSKPPLERLITPKVQDKYNVKMVRHDKTLGLIQAKHSGGKLAGGDIVVFFDCHVAPVEKWHEAFLKEIGKNYKRIVVPQITDLDIDTWKERHAPGRGGGGHSACYMTWDVDFKWVDMSNEFVPVLSGGLLGMSRRWWNETEGYDDSMRGWGGENAEQSLRTWLCGGEIVSTHDSRVAHMWRTPDDPRTTRKYRVQYTDPVRNKMRAAYAWMGNFSSKLSDFREFGMISQTDLGSLDNVLSVRDKLKCKPFAWFLHRFREIYVDGGIVPNRTFQLREEKSNLCLTYQGYPGVHRDGKATAIMQPCQADLTNQRWHPSNRNEQGECCSALAAWNTDQCLGYQIKGNSLETGVCDISGSKSGKMQRWYIKKGQLVFLDRGGQKTCLKPSADKLELADCKAVKDSGVLWKRSKSEEPLERKLYREELDSHPEWTV